VHQAGLAVQEFGRAGDRRAISDRDGLVAEADAEDGQLAGVGADQVDAHSGRLGHARTG